MTLSRRVLSPRRPRARAPRLPARYGRPVLLSRLRLLRRLAAWTLRAHAPRVAVAHQLVWLGMLLFVVEWWTAMDWAALARGIDSFGPARGALGGAVVLALARSVGPVAIHRPFARLLAPCEAGPVLLPAAALVAGPALAMAALFPGGPLPRIVGWAAVAMWASAPAAWLPVLALAAAAEALGDRVLPARLLADVPLLLAAGFRFDTRGTVGAAAVGWRPSTPLGALVGRDLRCLWRTDRGVVIGALAMAPLPALLVWGLRRNGHLTPGDLARAVAVLLCLVSPLPAAALGRLRQRLGAHFHPPSWPVSPRLRVTSLAAVFLLLLAPTHAAMAATGGLGPAAPPVGVALLLAAGAVWLVTRPVARVTWFVGWALLALPLAIGDAWIAAGILALAPLVHAARRWSWS